MKIFSLLYFCCCSPVCELLVLLFSSFQSNIIALGGWLSRWYFYAILSQDTCHWCCEEQHTRITCDCCLSSLDCFCLISISMHIFLPFRVLYAIQERRGRCCHCFFFPLSMSHVQQFKIEHTFYFRQEIWIYVKCDFHWFLFWIINDSS